MKTELSFYTQKEVAELFRERVPKLLITSSYDTARLISFSLAMKYKRIINLEVKPVSELPLYLSGKNPDLVPSYEEEADMLYTAAEKVLGPESYFSGYREKPELFKRTGGFLKEILLLGEESLFFKELDNKNKWSELLKLASQVKSLYIERGFIPPDELYSKALSAASEDTKRVYILEDALFTPAEERLIEAIGKNNRINFLPSLSGEGKIESFASSLERGETFSDEPPLRIEGYPHINLEAEGVLESLMISGKAGSSAIGLAGYSSRVAAFKHAADRAGIPVVCGKGLPLSYYSGVRLFLALLRLYQNQKRVRPLREIISSVSLNAPLDIRRKYLREFISEHKKNRDLKSFAEYISREIEGEDIHESLKPSLEFLKNISDLISGEFRKIGENDKFESAPFNTLIGELIRPKGSDEAAALSSLKSLLESCSKDRFFSEIPVSSEEKLLEKIPTAMSPGKTPDGESLYISTPEEVRAGAFEKIYYSGFDETAFSYDILIDSLFNFKEREEINRLASREIAASREYYLLKKRKDFLSLFNTSAKEINFSYSANDSLSGKRVSPSPFLFEAYRILTGKGESISDLEDYAALERRFPLKSVYGGEEPSETLALYKNLIYAAENHKYRDAEDINAFSGVVEDERIGEVLRERIFSPSQLSGIVKCPSKDFYEKILRMKPEDFSTLDPFSWLDALQWGSLIHAVLEKFYRSLRDKKINGTLEELLEAGNMALEETADSSPPPNLNIYRAYGRQLNNTLMQYYSHGIMIEDGFEPSYFEAGIGTKERNSEFPLEKNEPVELTFGDITIKIRGIIDRADIDENNNFIILDYKTGKYSIEKKDPYQYRSYLQHVLYPMMLRKITSESFRVNDITPVYYFCTHKGGFRKKSYSGKELEKEMERVSELLSGLLKMSAEGYFPGNNKSCRYCDYSGVCQVREINNPRGKTLKYQDIVKESVEDE